MAMSLNGIIAAKSGSEDFLSDANWETFEKLAKEHGCFIIGRKTYEAVQKWPEYNYNDIDAGLKIVISKNKGLKLDPPFMLANSPKDAIKKAAALDFKSAILTGGSTINSKFIAENLVDEIILNIEPAIIGNGIPLLAQNNFEKRLAFIKSVKITHDILQLRYKVYKK